METKIITLLGKVRSHYGGTWKYSHTVEINIFSNIKHEHSLSIDSVAYNEDIEVKHMYVDSAAAIIEFLEGTLK